jgi:hypothetical protein
LRHRVSPKAREREAWQGFGVKSISRNAIAVRPYLAVAQ